MKLYPGFHGVAAALGLLCFAACPPADAQTAVWGATGGNWSASGNWYLGGVPGPTTNVFFTNSIAVSHTITNDAATLVFGDLVVSNGVVQTKTLLLQAALNPGGDVLLGKGAILNLNGQTVSGSGTMTVTNGGQVVSAANTSGVLSNFVVSSGNPVFVFMTNSTLSVVGGLRNGGTFIVGSNSVLNVGGASRADAMGSLVTFTNASGSSLTLGNAVGHGTLNASTHGVGFLNQGTLAVQNTSSRTGYVNAVLINDAGGTISVPNNANLMVWAMPTNWGTLNVSGTASLTVSNGNLVNKSTAIFYSGSGAATYTLVNGALVNDPEGTLLFGGSPGSLHPAVYNRGAMTWTNTSGSAVPMLAAGGITNEGTLTLFHVNPGANSLRFFRAAGPTAAVVNVSGGRLVASSPDGGLAGGGSQMNFDPGVPFLNLAGATFTVTNGAVVTFTGGTFTNLGTLAVYSNSTVALGGSAGGAGNGASNTLILGSRPFENPGTVALWQGALSATVFTNLGGATLMGLGEVGAVRYTNASDGVSLTSLVRHVEVSRVVNLGAIAPSGTLDLGTVSNASGASIIGFGRLASYNVTNYYSGSTLITTNVNTGGRVYNASGATVLADGGTLVLDHGFSGNAQAGTVGTTNGGVLRLGDGTLSLTNSGTVRLQGGELQVGALVSLGSLVGTGAIQAASVTSSGTLAPGFSPGTMSFSNDLTLAGASVLNIEIAGTNSTQYDRVLVGGTLNRGGTLDVTFLSYTPVGGEVFDLFDFTALGGSFSATNLPVLGGGLAWDFSQFDSSGILAIASPIPEPGAAALLGLASLLGGVALAFRRRGA